MLSRLFFSTSAALLGFVAATAPAFAALTDRDEVMIWTAVVALVALGVLTVIYLIKVALGAVPPPPAPVIEDAHAHH